MKRVNVHGIYRLAEALRPLKERRPWNEKPKLGAIYSELSFARTALTQFLSEWGDRLGASLAPAQRVAGDLGRQLAPIDEPNADWSTAFEQEIHAWNLNNLAALIETFETVLREEAGLLNTYLVDPKGPYNIALIVSGADRTLAVEIQNAMSAGALNDYREAGRCLAFAVFTASGFHVLRALESVVVAYLHKKAGTTTFTGSRSWHVYAEKLEKAGARAELVGVVRQIKDLHRNPLMHPEDFLDEEEGIVLFGLATSAIVSFVRETINTPAASPAAAQTTIPEVAAPEDPEPQEATATT